GGLFRSDLAALGLGAEPGGELVDQDPVTLLEGVLHRVGRDRERLHQEGLDQQRQDQRDADQDGQLLPEGAGLLRPGGVVARPALLRRGPLLPGTVAAARRGVIPGGHGVVRRRMARFRGSSAVLLALASGPCANRRVPHTNSLVSAAARAMTGAGPPLP